MASINGTSSSTSSTSSVRGYGGLASGLDRDALIKSMTLGTKTKIQQQGQKKQLLQWKQDAYRSISSTMIAFSQKYTSYTSSTNLSSASFFSRSSITASGTNSKYVDVSGSITGSTSFSIEGVKEMAVDASATSLTAVSDQLLKTGLISTDMAATQAVSNLEGQSISLMYGSSSISVSLQSGTTSEGFTFDYSTSEKAIASINKSLESVKISTDKKLSDVLEVKADAVDGKFTFVSKDIAGNTMKITGGTGTVLQSLGVLSAGENIQNLSSERTTITAAGLKAVEDAALTHNETFSQRIAGKSISFTYNGTTKKITLPTADKITSLQDVATSFQAGLDTAFGKGRVSVTLDENAGMAAFDFKTTKPDGSADSSSVLTMSYGDAGVLGKSGAFGVAVGESNRLNTGSSLADAGLKRYGAAGVNPTDALDLTINGKTIEGLTYSSTVSEIMKKINETEGTNVEISYLYNADKFVLKSTEAGASGEVDLQGIGAGILFGVENTDYTKTVGRDAIVAVKYAGAEEAIDIVRGTNSFKLDGLNITLKDKFGYDETIVDGSTVYTEKADNMDVQFTAKVDSDKIVKAITDMITDYNTMIEQVNTEGTTKRNRDYQPLTEDQKTDMTEDQIKTWETKAKAGMLFNDTAIRGISDEFRFIMAVGTDDKQKLSAMGITAATSYTDNGKLIVDGTKLKAALESNPESVKDVFTRIADPTTDDKGGLMARMKNTLDKYAGTTGATKGILIERAGSPSAPTSVLKNTILKEMNTIDDYVERLNDQLKSETDRYITKFSNLETLISQMNSQSSWLSSALG